MPSAARRHPTALGGIAAAAALFALGGCLPAGPAQAPLPPGQLLIARTAALAQLANRLQRLDGTPVARQAKALAASLPDCPWVEAALPDGEASAIFGALRCRDGVSGLPALEARRGDRDVVFATAGSDGERAVGGLAISQSGTVRASFELPRRSFRDARALLLPASAAPGPPVLSHRDEIAHARIRPEDGLDVASLVPDGGQADQMFQLKSRLFAGAVLDGSWEAAVYLPTTGDELPRVALAVGFSLAEPAVAAMEHFIGDLEAAWPVRRSPFALGTARGACLLELNLLPGLAPCYVATDDALVIGWNAASVRGALADDGGAEPHPDGGFTAFLERIPEVDAQLAGETAPPETPSRALPWQRLFVNGESVGSRVHLHVTLDTGVGTG